MDNGGLAPASNPKGACDPSSSSHMNMEADGSLPLVGGGGPEDEPEQETGQGSSSDGDWDATPVGVQLPPGPVCRLRIQVRRGSSRV